MCAKVITRYEPGMEEFLISPGSIDEFLDPKAIFSREAPLEIEIGTGKGRFILAETLRRPEVNFIGIERSLKWLRIALLRAAKTPRSNIAFLNLDADMVIKLLLRPQSIQAYHVYFPDPWPKDRHHKRRLFNPRLLEKMAETLHPDGKLFLKTDHAEYYADARQRIEQSGLYQVINEKIEKPEDQDGYEIDENSTHFEIKFREEKRTIHSIAYSLA